MNVVTFDGGENMSKILKTMDSTDIVSENYIEFSKYVIATRAYPSLTDGCKSVHRRCIHCCYKYLPRHKVKSAEASGKITVLHPHPQSIYGVLVSMASKYDCKFPLFETKGNFGGLGFQCAAERYTELMLSDLAIKIFESFSDYVDMKPGEMNTDEPTALAALLPLCFLHGSYGIPTGMSTVNIPALNAVDLIKYYIEILKSKNLNTVPNVLVRPNYGNIKISSSVNEWKEILATGQGSIRYQANIQFENPKTIAVTGVPEGRDISTIFKVLDEEVQTDKICVRDETTDSIRYVIEAQPYRRVDMKEIYNKLERALAKSESYRFIFAEDGIAVFCGLHHAVKKNLEYTIKCCQRKLETEIKDLQFKLSVLKTIQALKLNSRKLKEFIGMDNQQAIKFLMENYNLNEDSAKSVLNKPISYLTREHDEEIKQLEKSIKICEDNNQDIYNYLLEIYKSLLKDVKAFTKDTVPTTFVSSRR